MRHHSGHYRHKLAVIWDPHPQYEFSAFGHPFHLVLSQYSGFVSPDIKVQYIISLTFTKRPVGNWFLQPLIWYCKQRHEDRQVEILALLAICHNNLKQ